MSSQPRTTPSLRIPFTLRFSRHDRTGRIIDLRVACYFITLVLLVLAAEPAMAGSTFPCTSCSTEIGACEKESTLQCLYAEREAYQQDLQNADPQEKAYLIQCIKKINTAIGSVKKLPSNCVSIDIKGPVEGGKVVFERLGRPKVDATEQGLLSINMDIKNLSDKTLSLQKVKILGQDASQAQFFRQIAPGSTLNFQNTVACSEATEPYCFETKVVVMDPPFPTSVEIELFFLGIQSPIQKTVQIKSHTNDEGPLHYAGKANDLRTNETWGAASDHGGGRQVFALDTGILGWNGSEWSEQYPSTDGTLKEHFRVYGMPVYAMADGTVCWALNDHEERPTVAGLDTVATTTESPSLGGFNNGGNQVFVQSGDEISVIAHLQPGSISPGLLVPGTKVRTGQYLGKVGLSGSSSHPHTHIHVKKKPGAADPTPPFDCDKGQFRPMTFESLWNLNKAEAKTLANNGNLQADDWLKLTNHSASRPYSLLHPSADKPLDFCADCTDNKQYIGVWHPENHIELRVRIAGRQAFIDKWLELRKDNFRLVEINTFVENDEQQYLGLFRLEDGRNGFWDGAGWDYFTQEREKLAAKGLRLLDLDTYTHNNQRSFVGAYVDGDYAQAVPMPKSWLDFNNERFELAAQGLQLVDIETFQETDGSRRFIGVYHADPVHRILVSLSNWSSFTEKWGELSLDGYRLIDVETFAGATSRQFMGLFKKEPGSHDSLISINGYDQFFQAAETQSNLGKRLVDIHVEQ